MDAANPITIVQTLVQSSATTPSGFIRKLAVAQ